MISEICYLILGTNQGEKIKNIEKTRMLILKTCGKIIHSSSIYHTEPWGFISEDFFLNQIVIISTTLQPRELLENILQIEKEMGRERIKNRDTYSSRVIDIDILFYGQHEVNEPDLTIPHPRIEERAFVLVPLSEINTEIKHPRTGKTFWQILKNCDDKSEVIPYSNS